MPGTCGAVGSLAKLIVEPGASTHTFDSNSEPYAFIYEKFDNLDEDELDKIDSIVNNA